MYYPYRCIDGSVENCKVHMHLHGCSETVDGPFSGWTPIRDYGWTQYAAANDLILIYP